MTSRGQCPRGVCACECPRGGCFSNSWGGGWMTSRGQCPGGGVLVNVFTPPPLQEIQYPCLGRGA